MNVDELERRVLEGAREDLNPRASDRMRHQSALVTAGLVAAPMIGGSISAPVAEPLTLIRGLGSGELRASARVTGAGVTGASIWAARRGLTGLAVGLVLGGVLGFGAAWQLLERSESGEQPRAEASLENADGAASTGALDGDDGKARRAAAATAGVGNAPKAAASGADAVESETLATPELDGDAVPKAREGERERAADRAGPPPAGTGRSGAEASSATSRVRVPHSQRQPDTGDERRSTLAAELAMLQRARRALGHDNGRLALGIVHSLDEQFPSGVLLEERSATRVLSLCMLERVAEARTHAQRFFARYPGSVYAERVHNSCAGTR